MEQINEIENSAVAKLQGIIKATPECIKIVAPDGSLQFMNNAGICMVEASDLAAVEGALSLML